MADNSRDRLTLARRFLEPSNSTHRHYEALRAFFVDEVPSAEAAARFGDTPASFRVLVHQSSRQNNLSNRPTGRLGNQSSMSQRRIGYFGEPPKGETETRDGNSALRVRPQDSLGET